jgi:hypothetical protein
MTGLVETNMKYVKLIAKPDGWFKTGTEAYNYDCDESNKRRVTVDEWQEMLDAGTYWLRGIWIAKKGYGAVENCGFIEGKEYFDGEIGSINELESTIVDEPV